MIVVAGTPRGGTYFTYRVLRALGLRATHEKRYTAKGQAARYSGDIEVSGFAAPHLATDEEVTLIVHLTRHPISVVNSLLHRYSNISERYFGSKGETDAEKIAYWWAEQHRMIQDAFPTCRMSIHSIYDGMKMLGPMYFGVTEQQVEDVFTRIDKQWENAGPEGYPKVLRNWGELPREVQNVAADLGYR